MGPLVSAIIPTYNRASYVCQAIESALAQAYDNVEIVVVDDGSTDDTRSALAPCEGRIRYIYQENQGVSAARNTGIAASTGDHIAFLDSDDIWLPGKLTHQMSFMVAHPEVGMVASHAIAIDRGGTVLTGEALCPYQGEGYVSIETNVLSSPLPIDTLIVRRDCLPTPHAFTPGVPFGEDWEMCLRIGSRYPIWFIARPLAGIRFHNSNVTAPLANQQQIDTKLQSRLGVIDRVFSGLPVVQQPPFALRAKAEAREYAEAAVGAYFNRDYDVAAYRFTRAATLDPSTWRASRELLNLIVNSATSVYQRRGEQDTLAFLQGIMLHLPSEYHDTHRLTQKAQAITQIFTIGFDLSRMGHSRHAIKSILQGLAKRPAYLSNIGVLSVLTRSFVAILPSVVGR